MATSNESEQASGRLKDEDADGRAGSPRRNVVLAVGGGRLGHYVKLLTTRQDPVATVIIKEAVSQVKQRALSEPAPVRQGHLPALDGAATGTSQLLRSIARGGLPV